MLVPICQSAAGPEEGPEPERTEASIHPAAANRGHSVRACVRACTRVPQGVRVQHSYLLLVTKAHLELAESIGVWFSCAKMRDDQEPSKRAQSAVSNKHPPQTILSLLKKE